MDLVEKIKKIAGMERIPETELILDEARFFMAEHERHGNTQLKLEYDKGRLVYIGLYCNAIDLIDEEECSHHNPNSPYGGGDSIIYSSIPLEDVKIQRDRRQSSS
jgi:hypothetical protein